MKPSRLAPFLLLVGVLTGSLTATILQTRSAEAARNGTGTFSLYTPGNPVVTGTTISTSWANNTLTDIGSELTNSLDRTGKGAMQAHLQLVDGNNGAPGLTFASETSSGLYRIGSGNPAMSAAGTKVQDWTSTGTQITGKLGIGRAATAFGFEMADPASGDGSAQVGTTFPLYLRTNFPTVGFNLYYDGANYKYGSTNFGAQVALDTSGNLSFATAPSGTAGTNATVTERLRVSPTGVRIGGSGGTDISASYGASYSITFGAITAGTCNTSSQTLTGVSVGGVCMVSPDAELGGASHFDTATYCAVTAANTVKVFGCSTNAITLGAGSFRVRVFQP